MPLLHFVASVAALFSALAAAEPSEPLQTALQRFESALEQRNLAATRAMWSDQSPEAKRAYKRLERRLEFDSGAPLHVEITAESDGATARAEVIQAGVPPSEYTLRLTREDVTWRVNGWDLADPSSAEAVLHRGFEQIDNSQFEEAHKTLTLAVSLADERAITWLQVAARRGLARIEYVRSDLDAAGKHLSTALEIARSSGHSRGVAAVLSRLANLQRMRGQPGEAEENFRNALEIYRQLGDKAGQADALRNLGAMASFDSNYAEAARLYEKSLQLFRELNDPIGISSVLNNRAIDFRRQGDYAAALEDLSAALDISRKAEDTEGVGLALGNIGNILTMQGKFVEALDTYEQALTVNERLGDLEAVGAILAGMGELHSSFGNYPQALELMERGLEIARKAEHKEATAILLHNIGAVWLRQGNYERALDFYRKGLQIDLELGDRYGEAISRGDVALALSHLGKFDEAAQELETSLKIAQEIGNPDTAMLAMGNLSDIESRSGKHESAIARARQTVLTADRLGVPERMWQARTQLARVLRRSGRLDAAYGEALQAITLVEEIRSTLPGEEVAQRAFEQMVPPYYEMVAILAAKNDAAAALEYAERGKGRVLLDVLRHGRADLSSVMSDSDREREQALTTRIVQLSRALHEKGSDPEADTAELNNLRTQLNRARLDHERFILGLYARHPKLRMRRGEVEPWRSRGAAALLERSQTDALVEYVVTEDATIVLVITARDGNVHATVNTIALDRETLRKQVEDFRRLVADRDLGYAAAASALYRLLWQPVEHRIGRARLVGIVPDGPLWELPFQILQSASRDFIIDRHALFYVPSLAVFRESLDRASVAQRPRRSRLLAVGNPVVPPAAAARIRSLYRDAVLAPLPETEREIRRVADLYQQRRIYSGAEAREERVKREARQFDILHFATHGIFDDQNPLYSRLLMSVPGTESEDGLLEAREIMGMDLRARMTVLSACETGRGRVGAGEGLIGLSWALLVAGCPTTVASQWKVSSASTTELMIEFHKQMRSAPSPAEALRRAALKVRSKTAYRHPFYWGAFTIVGSGVSTHPSH